MTASQQPLDLAPGVALGPFRLGSLLFNVLNHIREYRDTYPHAQLAWDEQNPLSSPVHLALTTPPLHLTFSPPAQRLSRIQVTGPNPGSHVAYRQQQLQPAANDYEQDEEEEEREDVVKRIRTILGPTVGSSKAPTVKGTMEQDHSEEEGEENMLCYPGVAFGVQKTRSGSTRLKRIVLTPLPIPKGIPIDQAWRQQPETSDDGGIDSLAVAHGDLHRALIELDPDNLSEKPRVTLRFHSAPFPAATAAVSQRHKDGSLVVVLEIGETTSEDILCELGSAVRTFWKEDDRLAIHTAAAVDASASTSSSGPPSSFSSGNKAALEPNPYFLSYPHLGFTLLISTSSSSSSHLLEKIILHSNTPGQVQFGRTARALWTVVWRTRRTGTTFAANVDNTTPEAGAGVGVGVERGFEAVREYLRGGGAKEDERPIELDRTAFLSSAGPPMPSATGHGYGHGPRSEGAQQQQTDSGIRGPSTEIYGFSSGVACEVTQSGDVETLWLF